MGSIILSLVMIYTSLALLNKMLKDDAKSRTDKGLDK